MKEYKDLNDYEIMYMVSENDDNAVDLLYEKYYPLICTMATKYISQAKKCGLEMDDLIQEGYIGLYNAVKHYRSDKHAMFYTYLVLSIRSKMLNCIKLNNNGKNRILNNSVSIYKSLSPDDNGGELLDIISDKDSEYPDLKLEDKEFECFIKNYVYSLELMESSILELKLNGFTQREIAILLGVSSSSVNKLWIRIKKDFGSFFLCLQLKKLCYNYFRID